LTSWHIKSDTQDQDNETLEKLAQPAGKEISPHSRKLEKSRVGARSLQVLKIFHTGHEQGPWENGCFFGTGTAIGMPAQEKSAGRIKRSAASISEQIGE